MTKDRKHVFWISIDDTYCEYKYRINISEKQSIRSVYRKICKVFSSKVYDGKIRRRYINKSYFR